MTGLKKEYDQYATNRLQGRFGRMASFPLVAPDLADKKVLDIGCSNGLYLQSFAADSLGLEQVSKLAEAAQAKGLNVIHTDAINYLDTIENAAFDAVSYSHAMEHVDAPICTLREIHRILRPGGTLVLGLPIENSLARQLFRHDYFNGTHLYAFTIKNTRKLLAETGFETARIVYHFPWLKGRLGENVNKAWNWLPFPFKQWLSMAYWVTSTKVEK